MNRESRWEFRERFQKPCSRRHESAQIKIAGKSDGAD
jgi:hypothetical protein